MSDTFFGRLYAWPELGDFASGLTVADRASALIRIVRAEGPEGRNAALDTWSLHPRSISILALELAVYSAANGEPLPPSLVDLLAWCMKLPADFRHTYIKLRHDVPKTGRPSAVDNALFNVTMIDLSHKLDTGEILSTRKMQAELTRQFGSTVARSTIDAIRSLPGYSEALESVGLNRNV